MSNYIFKRLDDSLIYKLIPLYKDAFGINISEEQIKKKYNTVSYTGKKNIAFVAIDEENNIIAASYTIFPAIIRYDDKDILCGQVGDLMTHSAHRRKGLFLKLAEKTHDLAKQEGIQLIFTFPYGFNSSYKGFVEHLGFTHNESFHSYVIPVNTLPLCRISFKSKVTATLYKIFSDFIMILFYHPEKSFRGNNSFKDGHIMKDKAFFAYKFSYSPGYIIRLKKNSIWLKFTKHGSVSIGDVENYGEIHRVITNLKRFCFLLGIRAIQIETSPDTELDIYLKSKYKFDTNYNVCLLSLEDSLPLNKYKFVFGDLDNF